MKNTHPKNVHLEYERVAEMLAAVGKLVACEDEDDPMLDELIESVEEACWLAQWKREYVTLDRDQLSVLERYSHMDRCE